MMRKISCTKFMRKCNNGQIWNILYESDVVNREKKVAKHKLIKSCVLSLLNIKSHHPTQEPAIYGIVDSDENEPVQVWIDKGKVNNFVLIMPKVGISWSEQIE